MSSEEFFMYLIITLIIVIPVSVRIYRYLTARRVDQALRREFGPGPENKPTADGGKRQ
jgi:hypothetical protein